MKPTLRVELDGAASHAASIQVREIAAALDHEARLANELRDLLLNQRTAVGAADAKRVNANVDEVSSLLHVLEQARLRRATLLNGLAPERTLAALLANAPDAERAIFEAARGRLRAAAMEVTRAAEINRHVLKRSLEAGEAFLQELFSTVATPVSHYGAGPNDERAAQPVLLDRKA